LFLTGKAKVLIIYSKSITTSYYLLRTTTGLLLARAWVRNCSFEAGMQRPLSQTLLTGHATLHEQSRPRHGEASGGAPGCLGDGEVEFGVCPPGPNRAFRGYQG
jgi:hypothetical protein